MRRLALGICVLGALGSGVAEPPEGRMAMADQQDLNAAAFVRLDKAAYWLVEHGWAEFAALGLTAFKKKLISDFKVNLLVNPQAGGLPEFRIKSAGINYDVRVVQQMRGADGMYEQWVAQISSRDWSGGATGCRFFLAKLGAGQSRQIIEAGDQYRAVFSGPNLPVSFKIDTLSAAYRLGAWRNPDCYTGTKLAQTEVYYKANGELAAREAR